MFEFISNLIDPLKQPKTIILFGETGSGKSSIINMLADAQDSQARVDNTANGVTFRSEAFTRRVNGQTYIIYDTVGLGESSGGTVDNTKAIAALYSLMRSTESGVHLLVYVVAGPRITTNHQKNYDMFYNIFCEKQVPIVLLLTHMDDIVDDDADHQWWARNWGVLARKEMAFDGQTCITGRKDETGAYQARSRQAVTSLIDRVCPADPWVHQGPVNSWLITVTKKMYNRFASTFKLGSILVLSETIYRALLLDTSLDDDKRRQLANTIQEQAEAEGKGRKKKASKEKPIESRKADPLVDHDHRKQSTNAIQEQADAEAKGKKNRNWIRNRHAR
ncbi:P-loop containing nucleoside triphosphate hydrolase protein [Lyophyllum atratum]|nr:P-loop containing nucleoside triphosphate hydrolase protein [Lyophyllum atratum]